MTDAIQECVVAQRIRLHESWAYSGQCRIDDTN